MSIEEENIENASQAEMGSELRIRLEELPGVGSIRGAKLFKNSLLLLSSNAHPGIRNFE
jgi:hypothetical protein